MADGRRMGRGHATNDQRRLAGMETARKALDLRRGGATYRQIAGAMGLSHGGAEKAVKRGLKMIVAEPAEEVLKLELDRLDGMFMGLWPGIQRGDPASVSAGVRVVARRAKLLGLDAPSKVNINLIVEQTAEQLGLTYEETAMLLTDVQAFIAEQKAGAL
jgi:hypothetical protein